MDVSLPLIALVGRPNVGKSTLYNRLTGSKRALMAATPGVTRDRREAEARPLGYHFRVVDTGGLVFGERGDFLPEVSAQVATAVAEADFVCLVVDGTEGLTAGDAEIYRWVARQGKPHLVLVNKADNPQRAEALGDFYALGTADLQPISALHGHGLDAVYAHIDERVRIRADEREAAPEAEAAPIRVAFLGRPNVGKSTLVNRILGAARMIVSEVAGTTREAIDVPFRRGGRDFVLIDTAGIRRRARTTEHLEKIGVLSSLGALHRADVAVLVVDAGGSVAEQDARLAGYVLDHKRALVVAMNKWDRVRPAAARDREQDIRHVLRFVDFAAHVPTSGRSGRGLGRLFEEVVAAHREFTRAVQTAELNRLLQEWVSHHAPPARRNLPSKVYYAAQLGIAPPRFRIFTNHPEQIREGYTRYIVNQVRKHFGFKGTPVEVEWRGRASGRSRPARARRGR